MENHRCSLPGKELKRILRPTRILKQCCDLIDNGINNYIIEPRWLRDSAFLDGYHAMTSSFSWAYRYNLTAAGKKKFVFIWHCSSLLAFPWSLWGTYSMFFPSLSWWCTFVWSYLLTQIQCACFHSLRKWSSNVFWGNSKPAVVEDKRNDNCHKSGCSNKGWVLCMLSFT